MTARAAPNLCVICGRITPGARWKTCSKECWREHRNRRQRRQAEIKRQAICKRSCVICGKQFDAIGNRKTCRKKCRLALKRQTGNRLSNKYRKTEKRRVYHRDYQRKRYQKVKVDPAFKKRYKEWRQKWLNTDAGREWAERSKELGRSRYMRACAEKMALEMFKVQTILKEKESDEQPPA